MSACTVCGSRVSSAYLCGSCTRELREHLRSLVTTTGPDGKPVAGWLEYLTDAAHGHTRLGESARRSGERGSPALCRLNPDGKSPNSFANTPGELLATMRNFLGTWIRDLCETRGIAPQFDADTSEYQMAAWLCQHHTSIANHPAVDEFCDELRQRITEIGRIINRPEPHRTLGTCPIMITVGDVSGTTAQCRNPLYANASQTHVQCGKCGTTHDIEALISARVDDVQDWLFTAAEVRHIMAAIGEPIPAREWRRWRAADIIATHDEWGGEPRYRIADVRDIRRQKLARSHPAC